MYNARSHETVSFFVEKRFKLTGPARTVARRLRYKLF